MQACGVDCVSSIIETWYNIPDIFHIFGLGNSSRPQFDAQKLEALNKNLGWLFIYLRCASINLNKNEQKSFWNGLVVHKSVSFYQTWRTSCVLGFLFSCSMTCFLQIFVLSHEQWPVFFRSKNSVLCTATCFIHTIDLLYARELISCMRGFW